eukprot:Clim_evm79s172 gene=Clim_evmTU79s172
MAEVSPRGPFAKVGQLSDDPESRKRRRESLRVMNGLKMAKRQTNNNGPRKLVIKGLSNAPAISDDYAEKTWEKLTAAVSAVHQREPVGCSLEELYLGVENMCTHNKAEFIYEKLSNQLETHIAGFREKLQVEMKADTDTFLSKLNSIWLEHIESMRMIRSIFLIMDRTYVLQQSKLLSTYDLGLKFFREHPFGVEEIQQRTIRDLLALVCKERDGEDVERQLLKSVVRIFLSLRIYRDTLEPPLLKATNEYYENLANDRIQNLEVAEYLKEVDRRLNDETKRTEFYLDMRTLRALRSAVENKMLKTHTDTLIKRGFEDLMNNKRYDILRLMYDLFGSVKAVPKLKEAFTEYLKKRGSIIVTVEERDPTMVQDLLNLRKEMETAIKQAFASQSQFVQAMNTAFEHTINLRQNAPAQYIAKFIDEKLRSGLKELTDEELEQTLDEVMVLFRFIHGKDMFESFYKNYLAKRLLLGRSASSDAEKSMLSKLKQECGASFTSKLEGMFKDIDVSKGIMASFNQTRGRSLDGMELYVNVLTTGYWPTQQPQTLNLPAAMEKFRDTFTNFYLSKHGGHGGRQLTWTYQSDRCTLKARFPKGDKELQVSLFQALILLQFNDRDTVSFKDLLSATGMEDKTLRTQLQSLACAKVRPLIKEPKGRDVEDDDVFHFNDKFENKHVKVKINQIQMKETKEEKENITEKVQQDRGLQVDAAIVRIMKMRKQLAHNNLIAEVYEQLKFPLKAIELKKRIESLIEREYLQRDAENSSMYQYLA